jgi:hypothetical protein
MITIYALLENKQIRYIGKTTTMNLTERLKQHLLDAMSDHKKFRWLIDLYKKGKKPEIKPIFTYSEEEAEHYEKLFISNFRNLYGMQGGHSDYREPYQERNDWQKTNNPIVDGAWISLN